MHKTGCMCRSNKHIIFTLLLIAIVCICQITELSSELADERNTGESASQLLESETSERLRLEKDMKDLQVNTVNTGEMRHP